MRYPMVGPNDHMETSSPPSGPSLLLKITDAHVKARSRHPLPHVCRPATPSSHEPVVCAHTRLWPVFRLNSRTSLCSIRPISSAAEIRKAFAPASGVHHAH